MKAIQIPKRLTEAEFEQILSEVHSSANKWDKTISFNFANTEFITSFGMTLFVLLCEDLVHNKNKKVHLILSSPESKSKLKSCMFISARLGFFENIPSNIKIYPFKPKCKGNFGTNDAILEVTQLLNLDHGLEMVDTVEKAVTKNTKYSSDQIKDISQMVSEVVQNIFHHSDTKCPAIISIQRYTSLKYVQLVIADSGIGIPVTLQRSKEYKGKTMTDYKAIIESIKSGTSQFGKEEERGEGLKKCIDLSDKHKATLYIRSNHGHLLLNFRNKTKNYGDLAFLSGTQVYLNFPTPK